MIFYNLKVCFSYFIHHCSCFLAVGAIKNLNQGSKKGSKWDCTVGMFDISFI